MSRVLMIVDLSNQVYKAIAAYPHLTSGDYYTGGLYGYMAAVCKAIREESVTHLVVAADAPPYIRSEEYPEYKQFRARTKDPVVASAKSQTMPLIRDLHETLGIPVWRVPGFEFDDLVARAVVTQRRRFNRVVAMSNDSDIAQLLAFSNFHLYKGKKGRYTREDFDKDPDWAGITPDQVVEFLSLTGTHNDVQGIPQIGPARAGAALADPVKLSQLLSKHGSIVARNRKLIVLPHARLPSEERPPVDYPRKFSARNLYTFCARFNINTTRSMLDSFEQVLG